MSLIKFVELLEKENTSELELVRKTRPYQIPLGYLDWKIVSGVTSIALKTYQYPESLQDDATFFTSWNTALWFLKDAPIYCLKQELLTAFLHTDVEDNPALIRDLVPPLHTFMLLFPKGSLISPEGGSLDYCVVRVGDDSMPEHSTASAYGYEIKPLEQGHHRIVQFVGMDSKLVLWFSGRGIKDDGSLHFTNTIQVGSDPINEKDDIFLKKMIDVVFQCLFTLQFEPELLGSEYKPTQKGFGKIHKSGNGEPKQRFPRWLGENYKIQRETSEEKGTHNSPRSHWRRGHLRRVPVGRREEGLRKWVRIQPVFVKGSC